MTRKMLHTLLVVGALGALAGIGTYAAFSSSTANAGNSFEAGTVHITDNDLDSHLYQVSNAKPGTTEEKCIKVTYGGSLDADVKMYSSAVGSVGQYVNLKVTRGSGDITYPSCTGATFEGAPVFDGTLKGFADGHSGWDDGMSLTPNASATKWTGDAGEGMVLKLQVTLQDDNAANGQGSGRQSTGVHSFTWQARNR